MVNTYLVNTKQLKLCNIVLNVLLSMVYLVIQLRAVMIFSVESGYQVHEYDGQFLSFKAIFDSLNSIKPIPDLLLRKPDWSGMTDGEVQLDHT